MPFNFDAAMAGLFDAAQNFSGLAMKSALEKEATAQSLGLQAQYAKEGRLQTHELGLIAEGKKQEWEGGQREADRVARSKDTQTSASATMYSADRQFAASKYVTDASAAHRAAQTALLETQRQEADLNIVNKKNLTTAQEELIKANESGTDADKTRAQNKVNVLNSEAGVNAARTEASRAELKVKEWEFGQSKLAQTAREELAAAKALPAGADRDKAITTAQLKIDAYDTGAALRAEQAKKAEADARTAIAQADRATLTATAHREYETAVAAGDTTGAAHWDKVLRAIDHSSANDRTDLVAFQNQARQYKERMTATQVQLTKLTPGTNPVLEAQLNEQMRVDDLAHKSAMAGADAILNRIRAGMGGTPNPTGNPPPPGGAGAFGPNRAGGPRSGGSRRSREIVPGRLDALPGLPEMPGSLINDYN
jgi:hypothetical protein